MRRRFSVFIISFVGIHFFIGADDDFGYGRKRRVVFLVPDGYRRQPTFVQPFFIEQSVKVIGVFVYIRHRFFKNYAEFVSADAVTPADFIVNRIERMRYRDKTLIAELMTVIIVYRFEVVYVEQ